MTTSQPSNFAFLKVHDELFVELAQAAERAFSSDPNTTLIKLRQLAEAMAQHLAAMLGIEFDEHTAQADLLRLIDNELRLDADVNRLFHTLRKEGNRAAHEFRTSHRDAANGLLVAWKLAIWFHRSSGKCSADFNPGKFRPLPDPDAALRQLQSDISKLKSELTQARDQHAAERELAALMAKEKAEYEALAQAMDEESRQLAAQAATQEAQLAAQQQDYERKIQALQAQIAAQDAQTRQAVRNEVRTRTEVASQQLALNEELTRILIDEQLQEAGWAADSENLKYSKGTRPEKGRNMAIAEWPTEQGKADYVLFCGLTPIATVEAKRENINVAGKIRQAERYARGLKVEPPLIGAWEDAGQTVAWPDEGEGHYKVPFIYSCNGRPYLKQLEEKSGTWFRDVRQSSNRKRAASSFHSPEQLQDLLKRDRDRAQQLLANEPFGYLKLRDYQQDAIRAVEKTLANDARTALVAMATGTGKTRTINGLMYRLLKAERFCRILFLVDRTALGEQAMDTFNEAPLEQNHSLSAIYNIAELGDMASAAETRVQVATVQAMVKRIFQSDNPPHIDQFDCIIIDEAHRGYTLDQDMTEGEMNTRNSAQYLSSYRRVLDYFDAVKIALTATPAKHTSEIFGKPVYTYSYREAVADDWLIDHEPPIKFTTELSANGITFNQGETVDIIDTRSGEVDSAELEDELHFDVENFNRRVLNENFNRVICTELATRDLDIFGDEKTLIFCASDLHADMVKRLLDEALSEQYGDEYNQAAVAKITGQSDKVDQLIRQYKNERYPNIAITVDLLTTGIDVPAICNIVFLRRVKSRILYEQMLGRATRRCDDIGKTTFRIYDPVDIYATLKDVSTMQPLVKNVDIPTTQLIDELTNPDTLAKMQALSGDRAGSSQADSVLDQLGQRIMRILRKAHKEAERKPALQAKLAELEQSWGVAPQTLHNHLHQLGPEQAADFLRQHQRLTQQLDEVKSLMDNPYAQVISTHEDVLKERAQGYGAYQRPEDYLDSFTRDINSRLNQNAAIMTAINRPRDLTRADLKEIRITLDNAGYTEAKLRTAIRNQTNQDIAAGIIAHIRRAALGEPLIPYEQRVQNGMNKILASHRWTPNQRRWLERLATHISQEIIVDRDSINQRFADKGGIKQLDNLLDHRLDNILTELNDAIWAQAQ